MTSEKTEVATQRSFEENMMDRIRKDIGELMPDDALQKIVERGMNDAFFKERTGSDGYGKREPLFTETLRDLTDVRVRAAVEEWMKSHADEIAKQVETIFVEGFMNRVVANMDGRFAQIHDMMIEKIAETFRTGQYPFGL